MQISIYDIFIVLLSLFNIVKVVTNSWAVLISIYFEPTQAKDVRYWKWMEYIMYQRMENWELSNSSNYQSYINAYLFMSTYNFGPQINGSLCFFNRHYYISTETLFDIELGWHFYFGKNGTLKNGFFFFQFWKKKITICDFMSIVHARRENWKREKKKKRN